MDYLKSQLKAKHNKTTLQTENLTYNLFPKDNYCIYSEILKQKAEDGIYMGKQTSDDNLITRSSSEKEFYKLMVNSGFGKMLQSDDKYNKSLLIHSPESFMKQTIGRTITDWSIMRPADKQHK
ncbi:hypothetical protein PROFUN_16546, partial [Planoprotostelium fungivorum]